MKKLYVALLSAGMVFSIAGCGSSNKDLDNEGVKKVLQDAGYTLECQENGTSNFCSFMNKKEAAAFYYQDGVGFGYLNGKSIYSVDNDSLILGDGKKEDMKKDYEALMKELDLSADQVKKLLKKETSDYTKKNPVDKNAGMDIEEQLQKLAFDTTKDGNYIKMINGPFGELGDITSVMFDLKNTSFVVKFTPSNKTWVIDWSSGDLMYSQDDILHMFNKNTTTWSCEDTHPITEDTEAIKLYTEFLKFCMDNNIYVEIN